MSPGVRDAAIELWRSGRRVPSWRNRRGYDRIEPWPPARLSELGRRRCVVTSATSSQRRYLRKAEIMPNRSKYGTPNQQGRYLTLKF
jgi:hypothetical protein